MKQKPEEELLLDDGYDEALEEESWLSGPIKYIIGLLLVLLLVAMIIPHYGVRLDPWPEHVYSLEELKQITSFPAGNETGNGNEGSTVGNFKPTRVEDFRLYVMPNDAFVKKIADKVASNACESGERICHAKALFYFVRDNFDYVADPRSSEFVKTARQSLISEGGDCDDASVLVSSLLEAVGIRTRFVFIPGHVYVEASLRKALRKYKNDGDWVAMDATCRSCEFGEISWKNSGKEKRIVDV